MPFPLEIVDLTQQMWANRMWRFHFSPDKNSVHIGMIDASRSKCLIENDL